ncbi:unnamed protein product, partial [Meganyctiphanes norvegica]
GSHAKNVKIRLKEDNSYEVITANGTKVKLKEDNTYEVVAAASRAKSQSDQTQNFSKEISDSDHSEIKDESGSEVKSMDSESLLLENVVVMDNGTDRDKGKLETFQQRQKLMEEQNKLRRQILSQAIAERKRRTQTEAVKLKQIQEELSRLDSILSGDVAILRDQIEVASLDFNDAQLVLMVY